MEGISFVSLLSVDQLRSLIQQCLSEGKHEEKLLTPDEVRKMFKPAISKMTIYRWSNAGRIPAYRIGGRLYFKHSEVLKVCDTEKRYQHQKKAA